VSPFLAHTFAMSTTQDLGVLYAELNTKEESLTIKLAEKKTIQASQEAILPKLYDQLYDSLYFYLLKPYSLPSGTGPDALLLREFKIAADRLLQAAQGTAWEEEVQLYFFSENEADANSKRMQLLQIIADFANVYRQDQDLGELDSTLVTSSTGISIVERLLVWDAGLWEGFLLLPTSGPFRKEVDDRRKVLTSLVERLTLQHSDVNPYFHRLLGRFNTLKGSLSGIEADISLLEDEITDLNTAINNILFENITSSLPVLLFPLRVETKFVEQVGSNYPYHLLVRVFPDDVAIQAHTEDMKLTPDEAADGEDFWQNPELRTDGTNDFLPGWRQLVTKYGSPRAAWIVKKTDPQAAPSGEETKRSNWEEAAYTYVMPEQFVVNLYETYSPDATPTLHKYTKPLTFPLQVGLNPAYSDTAPDDGIDTPDLDPGMKWLTDFEEAENAGMGVRIGLTLEQFNNGFERLVVAGLKLGQTDGKALLQSLFDNHHYGSGFKFIPQGTATNNTDNQKAGYSEQGWLDAEKTFEVELGAPRYSVLASEGSKADGLLLAEALGIGKETFAQVAHADGQDVQEAVKMNKCLWNATLGYYFEEMLRPTFTLADLDNLREFFTENVVGRGQLPAFSVGNQPYGVLLATAFSQWSEPAGSPAFNAGLHDVLTALTAQWQAAAGETTNDVKTIDGLLEKLGLDATSTEFYQRYGFGPVLSRSYLNNDLNAAIGTPTALYHNLVNEVGLNFTSVPKILESTFQPDFGKLAETASDTAFTASYKFGYLIDRRPFSETDTIENLPRLAINYIDWLSGSQFHQVRLEDFAYLYPGNSLPASFEKPNAMLYYMLRHSLLLCYWDVAMRILIKNGSMPASKREEAELFGILSTSTDSPRWAILDSFIGGTPAWQYLQQNAFTSSNPYYADMAPLREMLQSLPALARLPTARLERLFVEHLDLCAYRLDAWKTGQAYSRLKDLRHMQAEGVHIGAFGWLEDVGRAGQVVASDSQDPRSDTVNKGFIHAPSLNHATAAAILRQGYKSQQDGGAGEYAVELTSKRVRHALDLLEGVREGQTLNALLGYQFERGLHDRQMDAYIYLFRDKFPLVIGHEETTVPGDNVLQETLGARNVVDGLKLLDKYKEGALEDYLVEIGITADTHLKAVSGEFTALAKTMDALSDLMVAEGVYQTTLGKFDHASASLDNLSNGKLPPMPEILQSPRREIPLTQRVMLSLPPEDAGLTAGDNTVPWWGTVGSTGIATPMALAEPKVNAWLRKTLSCLDDVTIEASISTGANNVTLVSVSLSALQLQPIDWLYLLNDGGLNEGSFIYMLVKHYLIQTGAATADSSITLDFEHATQGLSLTEAMPLVSRLHSLVSNSRAGNATDVQVNGFADTNPEGYNLPELEGRLQAALSQLDALYNELQAGILAGEESAAAHIKKALLRLSFFNIPDAATALFLVGGELQTAATTIATHISVKVQNAGQLLGRASMGYDEYEEVAITIFGKGFRIVPSFTLTPANMTFLMEGLKYSRDLFSQNQEPVLVMDEWLQGIAKVKDRLDVVEKVAMLHEILNSSSGEITLKPVQLPIQKDTLNNYTDKWLGIDIPEGYTPNADKLSIVFLDAPQAFEAQDDLAGLLVDEWVEAIPQRDVTTAIAFHYDQPQSQPPQTLLLAVPPVVGTSETWNLTRLLGCINETLDLAKLRAVDTDQLATGTALTQLLPALIAPVSATNATIALDFAKTVMAPRFEEQPLM